MPQGAQAIASTPVGGKFVNIVGATAGQQVKATRGTLFGVTIGTGGSSSTLVLYDGTSTAGIPIANLTTTAQGYFPLNVAFQTGLFVVATGTNSNVTVTYA